MFYSLRGAAAAMLFVGGVSLYSVIDRGANYKPAKASVYLIDRTCNFVETTTEADGTTTARGVSDSCIDAEEWATVREKRNKVVSGKAVVHVSYTAPQDGSSRTAQLNFDGRDDEFYDLEFGDDIDVLVSNSDPARITKA